MRIIESDSYRINANLSLRIQKQYLIKRRLILQSLTLQLEWLKLWVLLCAVS